jgi:hypothetical protein
MRSLSPILAAVFAALLTAACTPASMAVRPPLHLDADQYPATGHQVRRVDADLNVGPWTAGRVKEGWTFSWGLENVQGSLITASRPLRFQVAGPDTNGVLVECHSRRLDAARGGLSVDLSGLTQRLRCGLETGGRHYHLTLRPTAGGFSGRIHELDIELTSNHRFHGSSIRSASPLGFDFQQNGNAIAAVETINHGRVWVHRNLDAEARALLVAASMALMLMRSELDDFD